MNAPMASTSVDNGAVLRIAFGGSPGSAAISTVTGLYYGDPFDPSFTSGERRVHTDLHCDVLCMARFLDPNGKVLARIFATPAAPYFRIGVHPSHED